MIKTTTTSGKLLVPLATLLAASAVAIGSGATWTSESEASVSVTSGELTLLSDREGATLTLDRIKPGDSMSGTVSIENTGDVDASLVLAASVPSAGGFSDFLDIKVERNAEVPALYDGDFNDFALPTNTIAFSADTDGAGTEDTTHDTVTYTITVSLAQDAPNTDQNLTASVALTWTATQTDGGSIDTNWVAPPAP